MAEKKNKRKKWPVAVGIVGVVLVASAAGGYVVNEKSGKTDSTAKLPTETVTNGSISVVTEGSGSVEAASTKAVALEYDGKLETIYAETGDQVKKGDVLAVYDKDALDTVIDSKEQELTQINSSIASTDDKGYTTITAPVSGRIKRIFATSGDQAAAVTDTWGGVAEISADGRLKVEIPAKDLTLEPGDTVTVDFDSYSVEGTVEKTDSETVTVTIPDDTEYPVDVTAKVKGKAGAVLGEGTLLSNHPYLVSASYGIIDSVKVDKETYVKAGDTLFTRKNATYNQIYLDLLSDREELVEDIRDLKEYQKNPVVTSEYDGYIVSMDAMEGMPYEKDQQLCTIADAETLNLKVEIDELDIDGVEVGQEAEVVFDAFEDETYEGTVEKISGVGNNSGGVTTYTVTIAMAGDTRLKNGMSATASITLDSKDNVLLVPVDAIQSIDGRRYVEVVNGNGTEQREITLGLVNDDYAEVTDGLENGEQVVVNTRESKDLFSQMMDQQQEMMNMSRGGEAEK